MKLIRQLFMARAKTAWGASSSMVSRQVLACVACHLNYLLITV